jgi:hypothetical protein
LPRHPISDIVVINYVIDSIMLSTPTNLDFPLLILKLAQINHLSWTVKLPLRLPDQVCKVKFDGWWLIWVRRGWRINTSSLETEDHKSIPNGMANCNDSLTETDFKLPVRLEDRSY